MRRAPEPGTPVGGFPSRNPEDVSVADSIPPCIGSISAAQGHRREARSKSDLGSISLNLLLGARAQAARSSVQLLVRSLLSNPLRQTEQKLDHHQPTCAKRSSIALDWWCRALTGLPQPGAGVPGSSPPLSHFNTVALPLES